MGKSPKEKVNANFSSLTVPKKDDIILAELTDPSSEKDEEYGILWNGSSGETYNYSIISKESGVEVASGTVSSNSTVFKVKGLPLEYGKTYLVKVGDTEVEIPFVPPSFDLHSLDMSENRIDCNTSSTPTNIEVIIDGTQKIPMSALQIKIEPPGFIVNHSIKGKLIIMIYNGRNTANILSLNGIATEDFQQQVPGQTPVPF